LRGASFRVRDTSSDPEERRHELRSLGSDRANGSHSERRRREDETRRNNL